MRGSRVTCESFLCWCHVVTAHRICLDKNHGLNYSWLIAYGFVSFLEPAVIVLHLVQTHMSLHVLSLHMQVPCQEVSEAAVYSPALANELFRFFCLASLYQSPWSLAQTDTNSTMTMVSWGSAFPMSRSQVLVWLSIAQSLKMVCDCKWLELKLPRWSPVNDCSVYPSKRNLLCSDLSKKGKFFFEALDHKPPISHRDAPPDTPAFPC